MDKYERAKLRKELLENIARIEVLKDQIRSRGLAIGEYKSDSSRCLCLLGYGKEQLGIPVEKTESAEDIAELMTKIFYRCGFRTPYQVVDYNDSTSPWKVLFKLTRCVQRIRKKIIKLEDLADTDRDIEIENLAEFQDDYSDDESEVFDAE